MQELEDMLEDVCTILNVNKEEVKGDSRKEELVRARAIFSFVARKRYNTLCVIGSTINRHHATIIHFTKMVKNRDSYLKLKEEFEQVTQLLYGRDFRTSQKFS